MQEQWVSIPNHPLYEVSSLGRIKRLDREYVAKDGKTYHLKEKVLKTSDNGKGYKKVDFKDEYREVLYVHRIVAIMFVPNPLNKPCVNHIDNNPSNNKADNLEWVTKQENTDWMIVQGRNKRTDAWLENLHTSQERTYKAVCGTNVLTGARIYFKNLNSVREKGFAPSSVCACCKHYKGYTQHRGYAWEYVSEQKR